MSLSTSSPSDDGEASGETKVCTKCRDRKPLNDFREVKRRGRIERHSWCANCHRAYQREQYARHRDKRRAYAKAWRARNPDRVRELQREADARYRAKHGRDIEVETHRSWVARLRKQGLTEDDYWRILDEQGGGCAICGTTNPGKAGRSGTEGKFPADHCHLSGASRGLLCHLCNRGLGMFGDDPDRLRAAADYLERER